MNDNLILQDQVRLRQARSDNLQQLVEELPEVSALHDLYSSWALHQLYKRAVPVCLILRSFINSHLVVGISLARGKASLQEDIEESHEEGNILQARLLAKVDRVIAADLLLKEVG